MPRGLPGCTPALIPKRLRVEGLQKAPEGASPHGLLALGLSLRYARPPPCSDTLSRYPDISESGKVGFTRRNPVDDPFADHGHRGMGTTGPGNAQHHRRIHHPPPVDTLDSAILIHDRHGVGI